MTSRFCAAVPCFSYSMNCPIAAAHVSLCASCVQVSDCKQILLRLLLKPMLLCRAALDKGAKLCTRLCFLMGIVSVCVPLCEALSAMMQLQRQLPTDEYLICY